MEIALLGPVQARLAGRPVEVGSPQHRLILGVLALEVNHLVPVDRLVSLVWPVAPPPTAVHAIQVGVSRLRRWLSAGGIEVARQGEGYLLRAAPEAIDVHRFTALVDQARRAGDDRVRVRLLDQALALWSGPALSGTAAADEVRHRLCLRLEETRLLAVEDRVDAALRLGEHQRVLAELAAFVEEHPVRERLVGQFMLALYRCGRAGEALRVYHRTRQLVADDLGLDLGPQLRELQVAILRGELPAARSAHPVPVPHRRYPRSYHRRCAVTPTGPSRPGHHRSRWT